MSRLGTADPRQLPISDRPSATKPNGDNVIRASGGRTITVGLPPPDARITLSPLGFVADGFDHHRRLHPGVDGLLRRVHLMRTQPPRCRPRST
ncbi:hypothetical protein JHV666_49810 [Mycobacterium avium subsp. hominissuis]